MSKAIACPKGCGETVYVPAYEGDGAYGPNAIESHVCDFCACGQPKKDPDDRQCPGCQAADDADEAYERARDLEVGL